MEARAHLRLVLAAVVCLGCHDGSCPAVDGGIDAGADGGPPCEARVVLGPIIVDPRPVLVPEGFGCGEFPGMDLEVSLYADGAPEDAVPDASFVVRCDAGSDYVELGPVRPGGYEIAIRVSGTPLMIGGDRLLGRDACLLEGVRAEWCWGARVEVPACRTRTVAAALACSDTSWEACALEGTPP